jgi:hypothetical protein
MAQQQWQGPSWPLAFALLVPSLQGLFWPLLGRLAKVSKTLAHDIGSNRADDLRNGFFGKLQANSVTGDDQHASECRNGFFAGEQFRD